MTKFWTAELVNHDPYKILQEGYKIQVDDLVFYQKKGTQKPYCELTEKRTGAKCCSYKELMDNKEATIKKIKEALNSEQWLTFNVLDLPTYTI